MSGSTGWGTELWDQYENLASHTQRGLEFCEKFMHFFKERCQIEAEYSAKLKKLVKSYQPKKKESDEYLSSCGQGFLGMVNEVHDIAGQHEVIVESFQSGILNNMQMCMHEIKQERKRAIQDGNKQQQSLNLQLNTLEKSKRQYEKAFKESEKALENFKKADADYQLSRNDVEKAKGISNNRKQQCDQCKQDYAHELQKTNQFQREHYHQSLPQLLQRFQDIEDKRIQQMRNCILSSADIERKTLPIIGSCLDGMVKAANSISVSEDARIVVDKYKSGFQPPGDIAFEDLDNDVAVEGNDRTPNINRSNTLRGDIVRNSGGTTTSGGKLKKRSGLLGIFSSSKLISMLTDETREDFSHLPPNQQKKKLNQKIELLRSVIAKETAERDGMQKMHDVYVQNSQLGDPHSLDKKLEENANKLDQLRTELQKYEGYLANAGKSSENLVSSRSGSFDDAMTRSTSDMNATNREQSQKQPSTKRQSSYASHDGGASGEPRVSSYTDQDSFDDCLDDDLPVIGTCISLYNFDASSEGSVPMVENEQFNIIERDAGDGWTRVRNSKSEEGFVPSSYIQCTFFDQA